MSNYCSVERCIYYLSCRLVALEQEIENVNEIKTKLELSIEVEKTKATSLQENLDRLKQSLEDETVKTLSVFSGLFSKL